MNKAIIIGAGQIGRGFIGMEMEKAGYHVTFADINMDVINDLNARGEYIVHMIDTECTDTVVRNISAMGALDPRLPEQFRDEELSLVCTSVGQTALARVAPAIAKGIALRAAARVCQPMNIIAVENAAGGSDQLRSYVYGLLTAAEKAYVDTFIGFPNCAVDRIIPSNAQGTNAADVVVEKYYEWDVERSGVRAAILPIDGMALVDDLSAYLERKFYTLNGPNAVTACLGYRKGYKTIKEALEDREIYDVVWGMMEECGPMLEKRHGFSPEEMRAYRTKLMQRFLNPYIIDSVTRVAREPMRKLAQTDRVIAPMNHALAYGIDVPCYYTGVASLLLYDNPEDTQSQQIRQMVAQLGVRPALEKLSGVPAESAAAFAIEREYERLGGAGDKP